MEQFNIDINAIILEYSQAYRLSTVEIALDITHTINLVKSQEPGLNLTITIDVIRSTYGEASVELVTVCMYKD